MCTTGTSTKSSGLDAAIDRALEAKAQGEAVSIGCGTAVALLERLGLRGIVPETLTDQTSAAILFGYYPEG